MSEVACLSSDVMGSLLHLSRRLRDAGGKLVIANASTIDEWWPLHDAMHHIRGMEHGCKAAEAFNHHPQSPTEPSLP